jgi:GlpG protein
MRLIGAFSNELSAQKFCAYLKKKRIDHSCDVGFETTSGSMTYSIWVHDEDRLIEAQEIFKRFETAPGMSEFDEELPPEISPPPLAPIEERVRPRAFVTQFFLFLCGFIFLFNEIQEWPLREEGLSEATLFITPIQEGCFYDVPKPLEQLQASQEKYNPKKGEKLQAIPPEIAAEIEAVQNTPYFRGAYEWLLLRLKGKGTAQAEGPLFSKIRQGQVWRLFSPAILHTQLLHILFNMLWLWMLGRAIEERIGAFRTLLFTLVVGALTNTLQYLTSGPFFLGYSGIVMGLAGFIWMREREAPWEGYPVHPSTFFFLALFVLGILGLQFVSTLLLLFTAIDFSPNIANMAHISGGLLGMLLGKFSYFASRVKQR